jgi:hypothetical protein
MEKQKEKVAEAVGETELKLKDAEDILLETKSMKGVPNGEIWWMERQVSEAKKFLPKKKQ